MRARQFPCGHRGKGQFCHRCEQEARERNIKNQNKEALEPYSHLPPVVTREAIRLISELQQGRPYTDFLGKRLVTMGRRDLISIPLARGYRIVAREQDGTLEVLNVLTHGEYSKKVCRRRRVDG